MAYLVKHFPQPLRAIEHGSQPRFDNRGGAAGIGAEIQSEGLGAFGRGELIERRPDRSASLLRKLNRR